MRAFRFALMAACLASPAQTTPPQELRARAEQAIAKGDVRTAVQLLESALKLDGKWADGLWKLGLILYQNDQYDRAIPYVRALTEVDPNKGASWALLGMCEFQSEHFQEAIDHIGKAETLGIPAHLGLRDTALMDRGLAHIQLGNYGTAAELLGRLAPVEQPEERERLEIALGYAGLHMSLGEPLGAEGLAQLRGVGKGLYLNEIGDRPGSKATFSQLLAPHPKAARIHYAYGALLLKWMEYEAAGSEFRAELVADPGSFLARLGLAYLAVENGETETGLVYAREAVRLKPDAYQPRYYLGRLLLRQNDAKNATNELEMARKLSPKTSTVRFALAKAYRALGQEEAAEKELAEFQRLKDLEEPARAGGVAPAAADRP